MNQGGFGFKDFIIICAIIMAIVIVTFVIYKVSFQKPDKVTRSVDTKVSKYESYEDMQYYLKKGAERYQNDHYHGDVESDEIWILSSELLLKEGYLKGKLIDVDGSNNECDGYVRFVKKGASVSYEPYIKCGDNYVTEGYNTNYINK